MSIDGYIDDTGPDRLLLSNDEDFDRVDQVRSEMDAILIGAGTLRADDPRLIVKSPKRRAARVARGDPEYPLKVTVTAHGNLDPAMKFWHHGGQKVAYTTDANRPKLAAELGTLATVVSLGQTVHFDALIDDLGSRGIRKLMVEGGSKIHTAFLAAGLVDEIQLAVAPIVVGDDKAPRFLNPASFRQAPTSRMHLIELRQVGDVVLLRYRPKELRPVP